MNQSKSSSKPDSNHSDANHSDSSRSNGKQQKTNASSVEVALRESEARFRALSAFSPIGIFQTDTSGHCLYTNSRWQEITGLTLAESLGEGWAKAIHPDDYATVLAEWNRFTRVNNENDLSEQDISESHFKEFNQEFRFITPQGQVVWVRARAAPIRDDSGDIIGYVGTDENISEAKLAEVVQKQAEQELRDMSAALSNAVEGISRLDEQGHYLSVNQAYANVLDYQPEELLGLSWQQTVYPEDLDLLMTAYETMRREDKVKLEARGVRKDGSIFYKELFMVSAYDDQKQFSGHHCFMRDISDRKQVEANLYTLNQELDLRVQDRTAQLSQVNVQLQQELIQRQQVETALQRQIARERLLGVITQDIRQSLNLDEILATAVREVRQLLQADRVLIFQLTADGAGVVVQESVAPNYPVTADMHFPDEWFSEDCYDYYCQGKPRIVLDIADDPWAACIAEFMQSVSVKSKIVAPIVHHIEDKMPFVWGLLIVHACSDLRQWQPTEADLLQQIANQMAIAIQQAELYQTLQEELQERQRVTAALRQSDLLFRSLSENLPLGVFRANAEGQCIYTNPRAQEIGGFTFAEALGEGWRQFIHPDDLEKFLSQWRSYLTPPPELSANLRNIHRDGTERFCYLRLAPILDKDQDLIGYVGTVEDITATQAIETMKNEFISMVSHELRTPLASIRGSLGLLATGVLSDEPETTQQMLDIAALESERLVRLVNDILDLERLESHKISLDKQWIETEPLMQQAVEALRPLAEVNSVALTMTTVNVRIWVDPDRLMQTLVNLVSNAIKFSPPESTITLTAQALPQHVLFQIQDEGRGIPAHKLETIFLRFEQVDSSDARQKGGTGLGLAICRNIVHQHGGKIWVESIIGQGSKFCFTVPIPQP